MYPSLQDGECNVRRHFFVYPVLSHCHVLLEFEFSKVQRLIRHIIGHFGTKLPRQSITLVLITKRKRSGSILGHKTHTHTHIFTYLLSPDPHGERTT